MSESVNIVFLHHSTGKIIMRGNSSRVLYKLGFKGGVEKLLSKYNKKNRTGYKFTARIFPKNEVYGWNNFPYDYYNIWVKNSGDKPFKDEPTLEILTKSYDIIVFKHCFPVSGIIASDGKPDAESDVKTIDNYKLQYQALKERMRQFPKSKFIVWTGAALVKNNTSEQEALRAREFSDWVIHDWDEKGDNIFVWDFRQLETEGDLYMLDKYAITENNSHPNTAFAAQVVPLFCQRIIDVIENRGDSSMMTGEKN